MIPSFGAHALQALTPQTAVTVDRSRCVRHRCKFNTCSRCLDACHAKAITWDATQGLELVPGRCTRCLSCLAVCPTAALRAPELHLLQVLTDLAAHPAPVLGCLLSPVSKGHARLPCLGFLANSELMLLFALVFAEGVQFDLTPCLDCPNGHVLEGVCSARASLEGLLPQHKVRLAQNGTELNYQTAALSRRELFRFFRERSARTASVMVERLQVSARAQSYGSKQLPLVRTLLLRAMQPLPESQQGRIAEALFGNLAFTPECTACNRCVGVCPTGALDPAEADQNPPVFDAQLCVDCGSCAAFCRNDGVRLMRKNQILAVS